MADSEERRSESSGRAVMDSLMRVNDAYVRFVKDTQKVLEIMEDGHERFLRRMKELEEAFPEFFEEEGERGEISS